MIHPHDTDRILAVLGEAIETVREHGDVLAIFNSFSSDALLDVANDLALLHGAVSAEAQKAEEHGWEIRYPEAIAILPPGAVPKDIDVKRSKAGRLRYLHREEIEQELLNGEHRDDDA